MRSYYVIETTREGRVIEHVVIRATSGESAIKMVRDELERDEISTHGSKFAYKPR